jgi:hypothetical protein
MGARITHWRGETTGVPLGTPVVSGSVWPLTDVGGGPAPFTGSCPSPHARVVATAWHRPRGRLIPSSRECQSGAIMSLIRTCPWNGHDGWHAARRALVSPASCGVAASVSPDNSATYCT